MAAFGPLVDRLGLAWVLGGLAVAGMLASSLYLWTRAGALPEAMRRGGVLWRLAAESGPLSGLAAGVAWILMFSPQGSRVLFSLPEWKYEQWLLPMRFVALALVLTLGVYVDWRFRRVLGRSGRKFRREGAEVTGLIIAISGILMGFGTLAVEALG